MRANGLRVRRTYADPGPTDKWPRPGLRALRLQRPADRIICVQRYAHLAGNIADLALIHSFLQQRGIELRSRCDPYLPSQAFPTIDTWWMQLAIWLPYLYWHAPASGGLVEILVEISTHERRTPHEARDPGQVGNLRR